MQQLLAATEQIHIFVLILARVLGILMLNPVFGARYIPSQLKIGLSAVVSLMVLAVLKPGPVHTPDNVIAYGLLVAGEAVVGLSIGIVSVFLFSAIQLAGQLIDMQMGFSIVNVIDPMFGTSVPVMGNFKNLIAMLIFLITNSHYYVFAAILKSFQYIPLFGYSYHSSATQVAVDLFGGTFSTAVKISLPVVGVLLIADVAMGILARTVPQMNIFIVGFPVKISVGIIVVMLSLPLFVYLLKSMFDNSFADLLRLIRSMG